jgi:two-component system response regulator FixJ
MTGRPVYLVDDDGPSRHSLGARLSSIGIEAWPLAGPAQFIQLLDRLDPGLVLIGGEMMAHDSLAPLEELARRGLDWPVVVAARRSDLRTALKAMKLGALDWLEQPVPERQLHEALSLGLALLDEAVRRDGARREARMRLSRLTSRETEVARALASGMSNKIVAHSLGISVRTAEMHRARILAKLGLRAVPEIVTLFVEAENEADGRVQAAARRRRLGLSETRSAA